MKPQATPATVQDNKYSTSHRISYVVEHDVHANIYMYVHGAVRIAVD